MEILFKVLGKARFFLAALAALALGIGMVKEYDPAYYACMVLTVLAIAADVAVLVLHRKLNIPVKYHENMFKFKKHK